MEAYMPAIEPRLSLNVLGKNAQLAIVIVVLTLLCGLSISGMTAIALLLAP